MSESHRDRLRPGKTFLRVREATPELEQCLEGNPLS